jgi:dihydropteroate synthase
MQYHESADYLRSLQRRRPKVGTGTTRRMLSHLGNPQEGVTFVQVAGSNGKGSTARMLETTLRTAGLDVCAFTSPGLNGFREQVRVDDRPVPKSFVVDFVDRIDPCVERLRADDDAPTHFEVLTALAIDYAAARDADVGVLEVGIGGRYDATSAVDPAAAAVTSVSLEHTELLGDTVEEIARDKAQVAPANRPLVTAATGAALDAIRDEAATVTVGDGDADVVAREVGTRSTVESTVSIEAADWTVEAGLPLLGPHQATNAGVAATLARQVADVDPETVARGLRRTTWPGRFEVVSWAPTTVLDGSHNPGAMETVAALLDRFDYDDLRVVLGAMRDKDLDRMAAALPPIDAAFATRPDVDRASPADAVADALAGRADEVRTIPPVQAAVEAALADAGDDDLVLVTGSLYAVAEARDRWTRLVVPKGRAPDPAAAFSAARFPDDAAADLLGRTFATTLRREQATRVGDRLAAVGGAAVTSGVGTPEKLVSTVVSGTDRQLARLVERLSDEGGGVAHLARQLDDALGSDPGPAFLETDGTAVMGVLNVTPDSFYDGGEYVDVDDAVARAEAMVAAGADVVDVGGESTRPGADPTPARVETERVVPVIEAIADLPVPVSVDTRKAAVADAALAAGADVVNDVSGLADPAMRFVVADHDAGLILMHSLSAPVDPDREPTYDDVVDDVLADLRERVLHAERAGIDPERIVVDPGCGFGKDAAESFALVDRLGEFDALGAGTMVGHSRKSMFEGVAGDREGDDRLPPTLAVTALAAERGVDLVRVHDVAENAAVVRTVEATRGR